MPDETSTFQPKKEEKFNLGLSYQMYILGLVENISKARMLREPLSECIALLDLYQSVESQLSDDERKQIEPLIFKIMQHKRTFHSCLSSPLIQYSEEKLRYIIANGCGCKELFLQTYGELEHNLFYVNMLLLRKLSPILWPKKDLEGSGTDAV